MNFRIENAYISAEILTCVPTKYYSECITSYAWHNFVNSWSNFNPLEKDLNFQQNHIIFSTTPLLCCRTTLQKLEVRILANPEENANEM